MSKFEIRPFVKNWMVPPAFWSLFKDLKGGFSGKKSESQHPFADLLAESNNLKDKHAGQRCFILGAGSSISQQDLTKLQGEIVLSVSNTFVHKDFELIKPKYHFLPHLKTGHGNVYSDQEFVKWLREMDYKTPSSELFLHIGDRDLIELNNLFKSKKIHWVEYKHYTDYKEEPIDLSALPSIGSVSELALTAAVYLGFKEIYLIGIDHDWFNGPLVYFYDMKKDHALKPTIEKVSFADSEFQMRRHAEIFKKYKYLRNFKNNIFNANANPKHYLDVFEKVDFDSLFK
jgi:hypothetical protein